MEMFIYFFWDDSVKMQKSVMCFSNLILLVNYFYWSTTLSLLINAKFAEQESESAVSFVYHCSCFNFFLLPLPLICYTALKLIFHFQAYLLFVT